MDDWDWDQVERLIRDLKIDGYEVADVETSTSHAAPEKTIFLDVERTENE